MLTAEISGIIQYELHPKSFVFNFRGAVKFDIASTRHYPYAGL